VEQCRNKNYRITLIQVKNNRNPKNIMQKYKLNKSRYTNYRITEIQVLKVRITGDLSSSSSSSF
jgi:hypothetical protein